MRHLLDRGHSVRSYDIRAFAYPEAARIDELRGDIRDASLHDRAFADIDIRRALRRGPSAGRSDWKSTPPMSMARG